MPSTEGVPSRRSRLTARLASPPSASPPLRRSAGIFADALIRIRQAAGSAGVATAEADELARSGGFLLGWIGAHTTARDADVDVRIATDDDDSYLRIAVPCAADSFSCSDLEVLQVLAGDGSVDLALDGDVLVGVLQRPHAS